MPLTLDKIDLLELRLYEAEKKLAETEKVLLTQHRKNLLRQIDPDGRILQLEDEIHEQAQAAQKASMAYSDVIRRVEANLNIRLTDYVYDDQTGVLSPIKN